VARRYRRSRHVLCYWTDTGAVVYNYATAVQAQGTDLMWQLLDYCADWHTPVEVRRAVAPRLPQRVVGELLESLASATFFEASDCSRRPSEARMDAWRRWNPSAGFFHTVSRQSTWGDRTALNRKLERKARTSPMPLSVKPPGRRRVTLPDAVGTTALSKVLMDRRTWRRFGKQPIERVELAHLLRLTCGITHWLTVPRLGEVPLKTSPSGGARHPIETYVFALDVRDIPAGVYRYAPERHELDQLRDGATREELQKLIPKQPWFADAAAVFFFTAVFERTQWRYEFARAYRSVLLETGHVCQTFLLTATSLGLAPFSTMAIDDGRLETLLGVDGISEAVLYAAGAGTRPKRRHRAIMPAGEPPARTRVNELRKARALLRNAEELPG
jgi:SagB-type dehydrogenase family enzyme